MFDRIERKTRFKDIERIKRFTKQHFALEEEAAIMVVELRCGLPGCPPLETVIAFWTSAENRHTWKVFKPMELVSEEDLPPRWMKPALINDGVLDCC